MNDNPYQTPKTPMENNTVAAYFFTASPLKFTLMSLCSFSLYPLYWFYQNWWIIRRRKNASNIMPFWRAFFAPIWAYYCFREIKESAAGNGIHSGISIFALTLLYILLNAAGGLPDFYNMLSLFSFFPVVFMNNLAVQVNEKLTPDYERNDSFSSANIALLVLGGTFLILVAAGIYLMLSGYVPPEA